MDYQLNLLVLKNKPRGEDMIQQIMVHKISVWHRRSTELLNSRLRFLCFNKAPPSLHLPLRQRLSSASQMGHLRIQEQAVKSPTDCPSHGGRGRRVQCPLDLRVVLS